MVKKIGVTCVPRLRNVFQLGLALALCSSSRHVHTKLVTKFARPCFVQVPFSSQVAPWAHPSELEEHHHKLLREVKSWWRRVEHVVLTASFGHNHVFVHHNNRALHMID